MAKKVEKAKSELSWLERQLAKAVAKFIYKRIKKFIEMKSWKTTLGGAIGALGAFLVTVTDPTWVPIVGQILVGLGMFVMGASARDNGVTSEQAGVK